MSQDAIDAETAAARFGVPVEVIRRWASERKRLTDGTLKAPKLTAVAKVRGRGRGGMVSLFRPDEVKKLADEWKTRRARRADSAVR